MPRWTILVAFAFVGTSVLTAYFFNKWEHRNDREIASVREVQSSTPDLPLNPAASRVERNEAKRCQCTRMPAESAALQLESSLECGSKRMDWVSEIEKLPPIFRDERARTPADFPRLCLVYMMKQPFPRATPAASFADCRSEERVPRRGTDKPCVTEAYVNSIYNLFGDVTSCFGIPQKDLLPEIFYHSSFHVNALGAGFETGLGFLRAPGIAQANRRFDAYKKQVIDTDSEACQRIKPYVEKLKPIQISLHQKASENPNCGLLLPPENPLLNLFYMSIRFDQNRLALISYMAKYDIPALLKKAGFPIDESEQLDQMLLTLASREGIGTSVILLKNYLQSRIEEQRDRAGSAVQLSDFDFQMGFARPDLRQPASEKKGLSFPAFLSRWEKSERGSYLSAVADSAQLLNSVFKEGTCVSDSYLSLSP